MYRSLCDVLQWNQCLGIIFWSARNRVDEIFMRDHILSAAVLSCDYSIWFINWNRCARTGGHSHTREGLHFTTGSNKMNYHHWHWGPLTDLTEEPKRCSQRKTRVTTLNMSMFTSPDLTYGRWKVLSVIGHGEWLQANLHIECR